MSAVATEYRVKFVNSFEGFDEPFEINFTADSPDDVKILIAALSAFYSGDPCECFINGDKAVLANDWGLMDPVKGSE